jgi:hypothetical protein
MFGNSGLRTPRRRIFYGHRIENIPWCNFDWHIIFAETATTYEWNVVSYNVIFYYHVFGENYTLAKILPTVTLFPIFLQELYGRGHRNEYSWPVVTQHSISTASRLFLASIILRPEDGGDMFLRNAGWLSTDYMLHPRRQNSQPPSYEPRNLQLQSCFLEYYA